MDLEQTYMKVLNDIIKKCEKVYKKRNNYFSVIALLSRLYVKFLETGAFGYADNAFFISVKSLKNSTQNVIYVLAAAFFEMETGRNGAAYKRISVCENYKGYLKNNQPEIYAFYLYIKASIMFKQKETRSGIKIYREIISLLEQNESLDSISILSAFLNIEYDNFGSAKKRLECYIDNNKGNYLFYICLFKYLSSKNKSIYCTPKLLYPFLKWGMAHGVNLRNIINLHSNKLYDIFLKDKVLCVKLYSLYDNEEILRQICMDYIEKNDFSKEAFKYYSLAVNKQIFIPGINNFFIVSSFYNNKTDFGIYPIKNFLRFGDMKDDIRPYIYYLVLSNKKFYEVLRENSYDIVKFGIMSVRKKLRGKYYDNIYKFIIENKSGFDIREEYIKEMKDILFPRLFLCEIKAENLDAKYCFVFEKNRGKADIYPIENGVCEIKIVSEQPEFFIADTKKRFMESDIFLNRYVENVKFSLYKLFYADGYISDELDMVLANYYLNVEYPEDICIENFERVLKLDISTDFRMRILAAVGSLYYYNEDFEKALMCFRDVELKYVKDKYIQNMFEVFIKFNEFDTAIKIIAEKSYCVSDRVLFNIVRKLVKIDYLRPMLVKCSYELLLKSRYDRNTIKLLTEQYKGSRGDWLIMCDKLYKMGTPNRSVDEKFMKMSMRIRIFDSEVQNVFVFMYENDRNNELIFEFAEYCCYEMIVNSVKPDLNTVKVLEDLFFLNDEEMISYALSHTYIIHNMKTENTREIINAALEFMRKRNLIFPIFKNSECDFENNSYIEKNYPFIYYAPSDKSILFYFREKGEFDFYSKSMKYLDFGIYYINIPIFFGEEIEYYICENKEKGSVETQKQIVSNKNLSFRSNIEEDLFFEINNSIMCENMGRYEDAEDIINKKIRKNKKLRCNLL